MRRRSLLSNDGRSMGHFRNATYVVNESRPYFDAAHAAAVLMAIQERSITGGTSVLATGPVDSGPETIDLVRSSCLSLGNHPATIAGTIKPIEAHQSLHSYAHEYDSIPIFCQSSKQHSEMFCARAFSPFPLSCFPM